MHTHTYIYIYIYADDGVDVVQRELLLKMRAALNELKFYGSCVSSGAGSKTARVSKIAKLIWMLGGLSK